MLRAVIFFYIHTKMFHTLEIANSESSCRESTFSPNKWLLQHSRPVKPV